MNANGYVFLDIEHPVVAWSVYRGTLISARTAAAEQGAISMMMANLLEHMKGPRLFNELLIEEVRRRRHPMKQSRLAGLFYFPDRCSAIRSSTLWGNHFREDLLAEVHVSGQGLERPVDSNWITFAGHHLDDGGRILLSDVSWLENYWNGTAFPDAEPIWEALVEGRMIVLGTELRQRAYEIVKSFFPESLTLLEIGRIAAWIDSDLGNTMGWLLSDGDKLRLRYYMDMRDAENPAFLAKLSGYINNGGAVNWVDIKRNTQKGEFGRAPDLRPWGFAIDSADLESVFAMLA
jgi:hypothetical protein